VARSAVRALARLPWSLGDPIGRTELASSIGGSSHALDDGTVLSALILRGIASALDATPPSTAIERRLMWERAGIRSDEVSTTVLTYGLRPTGRSAVAASVRRRSDGGCESHLTLRDLRRIDRLVVPGTVVWVCENPRILEAAMDAGSQATIVCTAGNPVVTVSLSLERMSAEGAVVRYRGDFDWSGVAIANRVINACGAEPWRMSTEDYQAALGVAGAAMVELPRLSGAVVNAVWDPELAPAMTCSGWAIHEELILETLVLDLLQGVS
jgi:uncharacterized protein (TIGR02679 family)